MMRRFHISLFLFLSSFCLSASDAKVLSIFNFENRGEQEELFWISQALRDGLSSRLSGELNIVEREDLDAVLREQKLALSGITSEASSFEIGNLLNATDLVQGSYFTVGERLRINLKIIDSSTGLLLYSDSKEGTVSGYFDLEASLAVSVGEYYGIQAEDTGLTNSQDALRLYYKGLLLLETEEYSRAIDEFRQALSEDPYFQNPRDSLADSYRFLKDFRNARYQRELNVLYQRLSNLLKMAEEKPFQSWGDKLSHKLKAGEDTTELTVQLKNNPEFSWGSSRAEVLWHAQGVMLEIADYAVEYFGDEDESLRMQDGVINISLNAKQELSEDPFLPELIYMELMAWYHRKEWNSVRAICESLMYGWPDYRMMWAIEDFYEIALEEQK